MPHPRSILYLSHAQKTLPGLSVVLRRMCNVQSVSDCTWPPTYSVYKAQWRHEYKFHAHATHANIATAAALEPTPERAAVPDACAPSDSRVEAESLIPTYTHSDDEAANSHGQPRPGGHANPAWNQPQQQKTPLQVDSVDAARTLVADAQQEPSCTLDEIVLHDLCGKSVAGHTLRQEKVAADIQEGSAAAAVGIEQRQQRKRQRLDDVCLTLRPDLSKNVLQSFIAQGKVYVNGKQQTKAGFQVAAKATVVIDADVPPYVCRAGLKLEAALKQFKVDVTGLVCLDAGLSTGGFTDCLLQHGAALVYGVDVGYGQVAESIRKDSRVVVMERTNVRYIAPDMLQRPAGAEEGSSCWVQFVTLDLSFISILKVLPAVMQLLTPNAQLVTLIKPQFEAGREQVGEGGVVRDASVRQAVLQQVIQDIEALGFSCKGHMQSPIRGAAKGNVEYLAHFCRM